ncbi:protein kinase domain-containing protein [Ditylenchus destructor]|nr:protein kinase domain-containing protein [Ditylenchus destructor]
MRRPSFSAKFTSFVKSKLERKPDQETNTEEGDKITESEPEELAEDASQIEQSHAAGNEPAPESVTEEEPRPSESETEYLTEVKVTNSADNAKEEITPPSSPTKKDSQESQKRRASKVHPEELTPKSDIEQRPMSVPEASHETSYLYIQMTRSFRRTTKQAHAISQAEKILQEKQQAKLGQYYGDVTIAVTVQNTFHNFSLVIQGFLSGLAVGHALFAFVFVDPEVLVGAYKWMAVPSQSLFYFCYVVSAVDALDRFEINSSFRKTLKRFLTLQGGSLAVLIWLAGGVCSALMTRSDEYLANWDREQESQPVNSSLKPNISIDDYKTETLQNLILWRWLSCARAVFAVLGWLLLALQPSANYLRDHLANFMVMAKSFEMENTEQTEIDHNTTEKKPEADIKDFTLICPLGHGSFGQVALLKYKPKEHPHDIQLSVVLKKGSAVNPNNENNVEESKVFAVKAIPAVNCNWIAFKNEMGFLHASSKSPFVVRLHYYFWIKTQIENQEYCIGYLVLKYFPAGDLKNMIKHVGVLSLEAIQFITADLVKGISYLHSRDVIHRDIKPENLLIDEHGHVVISDFGLARILGDDSYTHSLYGTPKYMAPEVIQGKKYTKEVDWWSMGATILDISTGKSPYSEHEFEQIRNQNIDIQVQIPAHLDKQFRDFLTKLLDPKPENRLGAKDGLKEFQAHPFLEKVMQNKTAKPPYVPIIEKVRMHELEVDVPVLRGFKTEGSDPVKSASKDVHLNQNSCNLFPASNQPGAYSSVKDVSMKDVSITKEDEKSDVTMTDYNPPPIWIPSSRDTVKSEGEDIDMLDVW